MVKKQPVDPTTLQRARELRTAMTLYERRLWAHLRRRQLCGLRFRCQHPIPPYVADFYCHSHRVIIELDGSHHGLEQQHEYDARRTEDLTRQGYCVLRFSNWEIANNLEGVLHAIAAACGADLNTVAGDSRP